MIDKKLILSFIEEKLVDDEVFLVELKVSAGNKIYVEIDALKGVGIDYCIKLSKHIEGQLDRDEEDFELEVSTSSISAPFKVHNHYVKNIGREVEVFTKDNKKIAGLLKDVADEHFILEVESLQKVEGKKKKQTIIEQHTLVYADVRSIKQIIKI